MIFENPNVTTPRASPLIVMGDGPGISFDYLLPLPQLVCRARSVLFYDTVSCSEKLRRPYPFSSFLLQAGVGKSQKVVNIRRDAPWLLTLDYYVEELEKVLLCSLRISSRLLIMA